LLHLITVIFNVVFKH